MEKRGRNGIYVNYYIPTNEGASLNRSLKTFSIGANMQCRSLTFGGEEKAAL